jgi:chromosome segregation ATPase
MRRSNNSTLKYATNANQTKTNITKRKKESSALLQDILSLKEQTQQYRKQLDQIKHETSLINESITTETNDILHIQTRIKDLTKSIHILTKDKDAIRNEVNAITKQLKSLRLKVNNFYYKNSSLMLNVNQLIHDNNL